MEEKRPHFIGYLLFTFGKIAIGTSGIGMLITTYSRTEPLDTGITILYTIIGVYTILHALRNAGSLTRYKKTL